MSNNTTEPLDDDEGDLGTEDFKNLRAKARKADTLERENAQIKRELAFTKAGIPMDDPKIGYFVKGYEGDLEPTAIKQAAIDAGFITVVPDPVDPAVQQHRQGQAAVTAASAGTEPEFDANAGLYAMEQAYNEGGLDSMFAVAQQYGVGRETNEV